MGDGDFEFNPDFEEELSDGEIPSETEEDSRAKPQIAYISPRPSNDTSSKSGEVENSSHTSGTPTSNLETSQPAKSVKSVVEIPQLPNKTRVNLRTYETSDGLIYVIPPSAKDCGAGLWVMCPAEACPAKAKQISARHFVRHWERNHQITSRGKQCPQCSQRCKDLGAHLKNTHHVKGKQVNQLIAKADDVHINNSVYYPPGPLILGKNLKIKAKAIDSKTTVSTDKETKSPSPAKSSSSGTKRPRPIELANEKQYCEDDIIVSFSNGYSGLVERPNPEIKKPKLQASTDSANIRQINPSLADTLETRIKDVISKDKSGFLSNMEFQKLPGSVGGSGLLLARNMSGTKLQDMITDSWKQSCQFLSDMSKKNQDSREKMTHEINVLKTAEENLRKSRQLFQEHLAHMSSNAELILCEGGIRTHRQLQFLANLMAAHQEDVPARMKQVEEENCELKRKLKQCEELELKRAVQSILPEATCTTVIPPDSQALTYTEDNKDIQIENLRQDLMEAEEEISKWKSLYNRLKHNKEKSKRDEPVKTMASLKIEFIGVRNTFDVLADGANKTTKTELCVERNIQAYILGTAYEIYPAETEEWINKLGKEGVSLARARRIAEGKELDRLDFNDTKEPVLLERIRCLRKERGLHVF